VRWKSAHAAGRVLNALSATSTDAVVHMPEASSSRIQLLVRFMHRRQAEREAFCTRYIDAFEFRLGLTFQTRSVHVELTSLENSNVYQKARNRRYKERGDFKVSETSCTASAGIFAARFVGLCI
jgi:hypothetical protein